MQYVRLTDDDFDSASIDVKSGAGCVVFSVRRETTGSRCPRCGRVSRRVHSQYDRRLWDLPLQGVPVRIDWRSRRFFCDNLSCSQRTFVDRWPDLVDTYARRTSRLALTLYKIGMACGGEEGARLAKALGMVVSPDTLLRILRRSPMVEQPTPRVLGVDDWAFRRGHHYGTVLCDLERHRVVDLLPERSAKSFAEWLRQHPGVEIISRDRGRDYAKGATEGAPHAIQIADRWHLLKNLHEAVARCVNRHPAQIKEAARAATAGHSPERHPPRDERSAAEKVAENPPAEATVNKARGRRFERYQEVINLRREGHSLRGIARMTGLARATVRRFIAAGHFPERAKRPPVNGIDEFEKLIKQLWDDGCHNARQLTDELRKLGFRGSHSTVRRRVTGWRSSNGAATNTETWTSSRVNCRSSNSLAWLLLTPHENLNPRDQTFVVALNELSPELSDVSKLARQFVTIVKKGSVADLTSWLITAGQSELKPFCDSLNSDIAAVRAALSYSWSNGQVEGQVNRIKLIKRQMYGRASFDLLRHRVLTAA